MTPPPPPPPGSLAQAIQSKHAGLKPLQLGQLDDKPPPKSSSPGGVIDEIKEMFAKGIALKHIDTAAEIAKRKKEKQNQSSATVIHELQKKMAAKAAAQHTKKVLVDQSVEVGKQLWKRELARWYSEVEYCAKTHTNLILVLMELVELREYEVKFESITKRFFPDLSTGTGPVNESLLVDVLNKIGFSIKKSRVYYHQDNQERVEFDTIIRPQDFPTQSLLKTILLAIQ